MKRYAALGAMIALLLCLAAPIFADGHEDDLKVIKKAVRGGHRSDPGRAVKWFKVLIVDNRSGRETVKITLPIFVARLLAHCPKDRHACTDKADIDIAAALRDLEELSPLTLLEIVDYDATVKIWLE